MKESISPLRGHALRLAILGTGAAIVWAALTLLVGTLSPAFADTEDAPPALVTSATATLLPAVSDTANLDLTLAAPLAPVIMPVLAPVAALAPPITSLAAPATTLLAPVLAPVTALLAPVATPLLTKQLLSTSVAVAVGAEALPALPRPEPAGHARLGDVADRPAAVAASAFASAPTHSPLAPTAPVPSHPAVLPGTSANSAGGSMPGSASDLPSGRSTDRATPGVLALIGVAVLPSTPTFDPGSTPD
ncbi:hypothetical protein [Cryobacterium sp. PH31-L1]|uniref:hypothetical protein n=1 Tax=Cryobacterium sp. PH31-L1 TaxID=3046199 RepID=UPI0024B90ADE|nr:hypothetical protein [Cryobacterium sp. PH31-L1]MDJ0377575.1 hypothetical protein [Cryobacterium sp. PH31-L1]